MSPIELADLLSLGVLANALEEWLIYDKKCHYRSKGRIALENTANWTQGCKYYAET